MKFLHRSRKGPESKSSIKQETVKFIIPKGFKGTVEDLFKMEFKGKYNEALNGWKTLLIPFQYPKIASQIEYMNSHKIIWLHIGICYRRLKMYDQSLVAYGKAKELARLADDKKFLAEISNDIAVVYRHQGKVDKALGLLNEAINTAEAVKDFTLVVTIHDNIAMCYSDQGLLEKAISEEKKACSILELYPSKVALYIQSRILGNLGAMYTSLGQFSEAFPILERALEKARETGDRIQESAIQNSLNKCRGK